MDGNYWHLVWCALQEKQRHVVWEAEEGGPVTCRDGGVVLLM